MTLRTRLKSGLQSGLSAVLESFLPATCVLCSCACDANLCTDCAALLERNSTACRRCGQPLAISMPLCGKCLRRPPAFDYCYSHWIYRNPTDQLVQRAKFGASLASARVLARGLATALDAELCARPEPAPDVLLPIPLHRSRLRQRGYNQALEIATELAHHLRLPLRIDALKRLRATNPQPGLDLPARRRNVRGAFAAIGVLPARVALVDDVMTSGATVAEAARVLKRQGVQWVEVWTVARRR